MKIGDRFTTRTNFVTPTGVFFPAGEVFEVNEVGSVNVRAHHVPTRTTVWVHDGVIVTGTQVVLSYHPSKS